MKELKEQAIRSGVVKMVGQGFNFALRFAYLVTLARLLGPKDFGLVAMVTVVTGIYEIFTTGGLASATIQKAEITDEQISTLFWINIAIGTTLGILCVVGAPLLVVFYNEPRLSWISVALAAAFVFNGAGVQHSALLQRQLRFATITFIELGAQVVSLSIGVVMALHGFGYWSLVAPSIIFPALNTVGMWVACGWIPGRPRSRTGVASMLHFGGTLTINSLVVYFAYNMDKILLGRFWGADALGLYGRAYQLINIPTSNINVALGGVAFSALSRLQHDPERLKSYFLKGYALVNTITIPITTFFALFASEITIVVLGPKWTGAAIIFRLLAPTVLIFGLINPLAWLLLSIGMQRRSLRIALTLAPCVVGAFVLGLPYGPDGVAFAYSAVLTIWLIPFLMWCVHGTSISIWELFGATGRPLLAGFLSAVMAYTVLVMAHPASPLLRLILCGGVMFATYGFLLMIVMGQKAYYIELFTSLRRRG